MKKGVLIVICIVLVTIPLVWFIQFSPKKITLNKVALHATATDCWMAINGNVYDATAYIASREHPGGAEILKGCGTDATSLYDARPADGKPHSANAREELQQYYIGTLSQ